MESRIAKSCARSVPSKTRSPTLAITPPRSSGSSWISNRTSRPVAAESARRKRFLFLAVERRSRYDLGHHQARKFVGQAIVFVTDSLVVDQAALVDQKRHEVAHRIGETGLARQSVEDILALLHRVERRQKGLGEFRILFDQVGEATEFGANLGHASLFLWPAQKVPWRSDVRRRWSSSSASSRLGEPTPPVR